MRVALAAFLLAISGAAGARSLQDEFATPITRPVGEALARSVGRALPVISASSGVSFTFDPATAAFERRLDVAGQAFLERPQPLGRGRWSLRLSYEWVSLDTIDGQDLDDLSDTGTPILTPEREIAHFPRFDIEVDTHVVTAEATFGVTDDLDVDLTVPVMDTRFALDAAIVNARPGGEPFATPTDRVRRSVAGIGDVHVRAKQRIVRRYGAELAIGLVLRTPTGEEENFQGTGTWELAPMLYAAGPTFSLGPVGVQPLVNAGVNLLVEDVDRSEGRIGVGFDAALRRGITFGVAVLGREPFAAREAPGFFDVPRFSLAKGPRPPAPFLGLERDRAPTWDISLGGRAVLWRDTVFAVVNVLLPLNRDDVRSDVIPMAGVEAVF